MDNSKILRFLQKHKFDLVREIPGYVDVSLAKDGNKLVLHIVAPLETPPIFKFEDEEIPFETQIDFPEAKPLQKAVVMAGVNNPVAVLPQSHGQVGVVATPNKVTIGPHEQGGRNTEAFEAWRQRNKAVKII